MNAKLEFGDDFLQEMLGDFLDESDEILIQLNENLPKLDQWVHSLQDGQTARCDDDLMNEMFRGAHSLKGLSGMLGLDNINALTHKVENIFDAARNDQLALTGDVVELIFQSVDKLSGMIECLKDPDAEPVECESVLVDIRNVLQNAGALRGQTSQADAERTFQGEPQETETESDHDAESTTGEADNPTAGSPTEDVDHFAEIADETEVSAKYLAIFIDESERALDEVSETLLAEKTEKCTESLMILCHKIKGSAAAIGLNRAAKLAHFMEDLLQELMQSGKQLSVDMTDAMLKCTDALRGYVDGLKTGDAQSSSFNEVSRQLLAAQLAGADGVSAQRAQGQFDSATSKAAEATPEPSVGLTDARRAEVAAAAPDDPPSWIAQVIFQQGLSLAGLKASLVYQRMSELGRVFYCYPPRKQLDEMNQLHCLTLGVASDDNPDSIRRKVQVEGIERLELEPLSDAESTSDERPSGPVDAVAETSKPTPKPSVGPATGKSAEPSTPQKSKSDLSKTAAAKANKKPTETLRVDIERLDQLMNLAGQLVINKARFSQIGEGLKRLTTSKQAANSLSDAFGMIDRLSRDVDKADGQRKGQLDLDNLRGHVGRLRADLEHVQREMEQFSQARTMINELSETVHQLDRVTDGIQKTVMDTRMVPVGPLFRRFKRVIRDITRNNGKDIRLVIRGENTELDKRMIDELGDPLIHMVRNCADHGIEPPEVRQAAGKPRQGTVTLNAFHRGNSILIEITDDGKGLDPEKIRDKAIEKGFVSPSDIEKLTTHQIFQLIWEPGLSTAEKVTEVSGRGMGMDIVRTKIEELNGAVELDSKVGEGTTITIKLPLTLAILPSLLVEIDGDVIAMPVESVSEIVSVSDGDLSTVHGLQTATVRGRVISVVNLSGSR